jgi:hypothetical protein
MVRRGTPESIGIVGAGRELVQPAEGVGERGRPLTCEEQREKIALAVRASATVWGR